MTVPRADANLTREEARRRAELIDSPVYSVALDLARGEERFGCETSIRFRCARPGADTFLDFLGVSVEAIDLNGSGVPAEAFDGTRIHLTDLRDANEVNVRATCAYQTTGAGLTIFRDPVDDRVYLHSQLEPFDANRIFPCFDQPDLKATFEFIVYVPADWSVISNNPGRSEPVPDRSGVVCWRFPATKKLSTYLTAIVAGPYHAVHTAHRGVELGIFCRQSLVEYLDPDEILQVTKDGLDFYENAYGIPYPFGKYDQLFVPAFSAGGMENAGAVTLTEFLVFRSRVTEATRELRAKTLLHEMAHMWFGDLVTMRWWDDLWLNESFATFMSYLCQVSATRFTNAWTTFANEEKAGARRQDQLPTTHPIAADVVDTESVHLNFDAITYNKGASVLRQLVAFVGQDTFLSGVQRYLSRRQYSNADLSDFLSDVELGSGRDLSAWSREWLSTAGVNTLGSIWTAGSSHTFSSFVIEQSAPVAHPTLRSHRLTVGLYDLHGQELRLRRRIEVDVAGAATPVPALIGERIPDLVLLNDADLTYAKVRLDPQSMGLVTRHLAGLADPLARAIIWGATWDMLRDAELPARDYVRLVLGNLTGEPEISVVEGLIEQCLSAIQVYADPAYQPQLLSDFAARARREVEGAQAGTDFQLAWARAFIRSARSSEELAILAGLLDGSRTYPGLTMDVDLRWSVVTSLARTGAAGDSLIESELQRDPTDAGRRYAAATRAARPTPEAKADAWTALTTDTSIPLATMRAIMRGFQQPEQVQLLEPYATRYFDVLDEIWRTRTIEVALAFIGGMYPRVVIGDAVVNLTSEYLVRDAVPGPIRRVLLEGRDQMQRAIRARDADAKAVSSAPDL